MRPLTSYGRSAPAIFLAILLISPQFAEASDQFAILVPLTKDADARVKDGKDTARLDVTADIIGDVRFTIFPADSEPLNTSPVPLSSDYFASSVDSDVPNLFSVTGNHAALVRVGFDLAAAQAVLRISGRKGESVMSIPPREREMGTAFAFPLGNPGQRTTIYVGNPSAGSALVRVRLGLLGAPPKYQVEIPAWGVGAVVLDPSDRDTRVMVDQAGSYPSPMIVMLEVVDSQGNISRTFIAPPGL